MVSNKRTNAPWDQRLADRMARQSWEAANDPAGRRGRPSFREQMRSRYFKFAVVVSVGALLTLFLGHATWNGVVGGALYLASLVLWRLTAVDARAASLARTATKEST
jgi:hypothetical protein